MPTLLADPPAAPSSEQPPAPESSGAPAVAGAGTAAERHCEKCGASMEPAQEWCLQCGAAAPGGLATRTPGWRSSAVVLGATALLALGAAGAAYAALTNKKVRHVVIVQVPAQAAATPTAPPPTTTPALPATPPTPKPLVPTTAVKPPKIPLTVPTPKSTVTPKATTIPPAATTTPTSTTPKKTAAKNPAAQLPPALVLDTNSVATYNPEGYPVETFGDPNLAVDGDSSTGWTARVNPTIAPKMAVGLLIDLNTARKLSALQLVTPTPGMTVQVFGSSASSAPPAITDPAWTALSAHQLQKERHTLIKLSDSTKAFRFVILWISGAPPGSIGTPTAPGRVAVNEVEVFPAK